MSTLTTATPAHNISALLLSNAEFSLCEGAVSLADAQGKPWRDFGNLKAYNVDNTATTKEHIGAYRGQMVRDRTSRRELKLGYKLTADEWTPENLRYLLMGDQGDEYTQAAAAAVPGVPIPFSVGAPARGDRWYDVLLPGTGTPAYGLLAVTFPALAEGTDFEVDRQLARVRFLRPQTAALTPVITAPAITAAANDPNAMAVITPGTRGQVSGIGRLAGWDDNAKNNLVMDHYGFGCDLFVDGAANVTGTDFSDLSIMVSMKPPFSPVRMPRNR